MFKCLECGKIDLFSLLLSKDYSGPGIFEQSYNEHNEIIIDIDGYKFVPDLGFMNSHAVCKFCGCINNFEYFFQHLQEEENNNNSTESVSIEVNKQ